MLTIRTFQKGQDEQIYVSLYNAGFLDYDDIRTVTLDEVQTLEKAPSQNLDGLLIAEWDGRAVGMVQAFVDRLREEKKGFIHSLTVSPEFRRMGIAKRLVSEAIRILKERGMNVAQTWAWMDREACVRLYEGFSFKPIRVTSLMKANLKGIPQDTSANREAVLREMKIAENAEIALMTRLENEAFKEHFNYRPITVEEKRYMLLEMPWYQHQKAWCASIKNQPVGYVVAGIDIRSNREKHVDYGWVLDIGVLKPYRRRGIGSVLIQEARRYLKSMRMDSALLYVDDMNPTGAIKLYEKVGFVTYHKNGVYELSLA